MPRLPQLRGANKLPSPELPQAGKTVNLSFKVQGTLQQLKVKVGDKVNKGQLIAQIDPIDYRVSYDQALAQLKNAQTQIEASNTQLVRFPFLLFQSGEIIRK